MKTKYKLLSFILPLFLLVACGNDEETYQVKEQQLNTAVYASGKIMPLEYDDIKSTINAKVLKILVKSGDTVHADQTVAILGSIEGQEQIPFLKEQIDILENQSQASSDILQQIEEQINTAEKQYQQDQQNANRYMELAKDTAVSKELAETMQLKAQESYSNLQNLKRQLSVKKQELNAQLLQLKSNLKNIESQQNTNVLKSTIDGIVLNVRSNIGDNVSPNETVLFVGTPNKYILDLIVDERDITKIKVGQNIIFQTDAYANQSFKAQINQINPVLEENTRSFRIKANVTSDTLFYSKSSVEANIVISTQPNILMIPKNYLLDGDSLWVKDEDNKQKVAVKTGASNNGKIVILSGLMVNDVIIKPE